MGGDEIRPETRLLLIELLEGMAEGVRKNDIRFSEGNARALAAWADGVLHPEQKRRQEEMPYCSISEACDLLHITQPTFRKYVKSGHLPKGVKISTFREDVWLRKEIKAIYDSGFFDKKKRCK